MCSEGSCPVYSEYIETTNFRSSFALTLSCMAGWIDKYSSAFKTVELDESTAANVVIYAIKDGNNMGGRE